MPSTGYLADSLHYLMMKSNEGSIGASGDIITNNNENANLFMSNLLQQIYSQNASNNFPFNADHFNHHQQQHQQNQQIFNEYYMKLLNYNQLNNNNISNNSSNKLQASHEDYDLVSQYHNTCPQIELSRQNYLANQPI